MIDPDYVGNNVSPEHRAKFKGNLWIWVLAAVVGLLTVCAMSLGVIAG